VCQVELERTAHFFKLRQAEINRLVAQWRSTVEKMRQIDSEVGKAIRDYNMQSALKRSMMEELKHSKERVQILDVSLPPEVFYSFFSLHV
jgi:hypothetical protein